VSRSPTGGNGSSRADRGLLSRTRHRLAPCETSRCRTVVRPAQRVLSESAVFTSQETRPTASVVAVITGRPRVSPLRGLESGPGRAESPSTFRRRVRPRAPGASAGFRAGRPPPGRPRLSPDPGRGLPESVARSGCHRSGGRGGPCLSRGPDRKPALVHPPESRRCETRAPGTPLVRSLAALSGSGSVSGPAGREDRARPLPVRGVAGIVP
jgi:hypothetical protein